MATKTQGSLVGVVIAIITVVGVGTYSFDFSNTTSTNLDNSGDEVTNFFGDISDDFAYEATMTAICSKSPIDPEYVNACIEWESDD